MNHIRELGDQNIKTEAVEVQFLTAETT